ncbi:unnamed protein product, partial [Prorocentrum cordatum]
EGPRFRASQQALRSVARAMRSAALALSSGAHAGADDFAHRMRLDVMKDSVLKLDRWADDLASAAGETRQGIGKFRHSSLQLVEVIRTAAFVKGGPSRLHDGVSGVDADYDDQLRDPSTLPSASTVARGHLSLDVAMALNRRRTFHPDTFRYLWTDSSPHAGFDWLWSQCHEIRRDRVVQVCKDVHLLITRIAAHAETIEKSGGAVPHDPLPEWAPLLKSMLDIREHVFVPTSLAMGRTGISHKISALVHQWGLELPEGVGLKAMARSFISHTSDMGVEMSIPDYSVADHEGLSATWLDRAPLRLDAECVPPAFEDRGDLSAAGAERAVEADCQMSE